MPIYVQPIPETTVLHVTRVTIIRVSGNRDDGEDGVTS